MNTEPAGTVRILPWTADDLPALERSNTEEMTVYLGGPESREKLLDRHARYLRLGASGEARMFTVRVDGITDAVGTIGYWNITWRDAPVYESGWSIATGYHGRGFASAALAACLVHAADHGDRDSVLAFPRTDNAASNHLCQSAGFDLVGEEDAEYPAGNPIRVNAWRFDLRPLRAARDTERHRGLLAE